MTPDEILEVDAERNHPPGTIAGHLRADINEELRKGGDIIQQGNVLIVYRTVEPGVVEHHSFNADTAENLIKANVALWTMLKRAGATIARTQYQNPKVTALFNGLSDKFDITITQDGQDFTAEVRL